MIELFTKLASSSSCPFGKKCEFLELSNMVHGFLLEGDRSVEAVAVTARLIMKQTAEFLEKFMHYSGEPEVVRITEQDEQSQKDFDMRLTTCRTEAKLYMCINGQWV